MNVKLLKLKTGEEIICDVVSENGPVISNPVTIGLQRDPQSGRESMTMHPWVPFAKDKNMTIAHRGLLLEPMDVVQELENAYIEAITGIKKPSQSDIIQING